VDLEIGSTFVSHKSCGPFSWPEEIRPHQQSVDAETLFYEYGHLRSELAITALKHPDHLP
jgi:hypothetical protein